MSIDVRQYYEKYGPMVLRRCRQLLKNEEKALDAMQDTFVRLLQYRNKITARAPSSLLYRMATNVCLNIIRSESRRPQTPDDAMLQTIAAVDNFEEKVWAGDLLDRIFHKEKPSTREIAVLHYVDKMTLQQVADEVGLSLSGVRKRLRTLKARIGFMEEVQT